MTTSWWLGAAFRVRFDERPSQSAYLAFEHIEHADPLIRAFERHARANLSRPLAIAGAPRAIDTSPAHAGAPRGAGALGLSPIALVQRVRAERRPTLRGRPARRSSRWRHAWATTNASTLEGPAPARGARRPPRAAPGTRPRG